jgi:Lar family restriction alleviation protein
MDHLIDDSDRLKPCPFCGGEAEWNQCEGDPLNLNDPMAGANWIECLKCGASTNLRYSLMDDCRPLLGEQWNRRVAAAIAEKNEAKS